MALGLGLHPVPDGGTGLKGYFFTTKGTVISNITRRLAVGLLATASICFSHAEAAVSIVVPQDKKDDAGLMLAAADIQRATADSTIVYYAPPAKLPTGDLILIGRPTAVTPVPGPPLKPEGFRIRAAGLAGRKSVVIEGDQRGTMYGAFKLAEKIRLGGRKKGSRVFCRNGPKGASHKRLPPPFFAPPPALKWARGSPSPNLALDILFRTDIRELVPASVAGTAVPGRAVQKPRIPTVVSITSVGVAAKTSGWHSRRRVFSGSQRSCRSATRTILRTCPVQVVCFPGKTISASRYQ